MSVLPPQQKDGEIKFYLIKSLPYRERMLLVALALSGGLDSLVLLHALSRLREQHALPPLRALHVAHGLQTVAEDWPTHCQTCCEAWQVPFEVLAVQVPREASLEQAARSARRWR